MPVGRHDGHSPSRRSTNDAERAYRGQRMAHSLRKDGAHPLFVEAGVFEQLPGAVYLPNDEDAVTLR